MLLNPEQIIADRYQIIEQIGVGGMAIVYVAKDLKLDRHITFKVLKEEHLTDDFVFSKFSVEAKAAASLNDKNIVSVYDVGVENNIHYIVMEYIDGITLKELIKTRAPFRNEEAIGVAIQIGEALSRAHANKIVHQDIKPQNILLTNEGVVKVTDFGIASAQVSTATTTASTPVGSVHYFSPEQARGRYVDHRSDIYSLGIVLYEMVTGSIPFDGDSSVAIAIKHINDPIPEIPNEVSRSLKSIIHKSTKKLSNQRYSTIEDMLEDLKLAITDETPVTERESFDIEATITLDAGEQEEINARLAEVAISNTDDGIKLPINRMQQRPQQPQQLQPHQLQQQRPSFDIFNPSGGTDPDQARKNLEKKVVYIGIGTAVVIILIILSIMLMELFFTGNNNDGQEIVLLTVTPDVQGLPMEESIYILEQYDVEISIVTEYHDNIPDGIVISQSIEPGTPIQDIQIIQIIVSQGEFNFVVPNFIGTSFVNVQSALENVAGITLNHVLVSSEEPVASVISQNPQPGVSLRYGGIIEIEISGGTDEPISTVPNMVGLNEVAAVASLQQAGLAPSISRVHHDDIPSGNIISQTDPPGSTIAAGSSVGIMISLGPAETIEEIPEVINNEIEINDISEVDEPQEIEPPQMAVMTTFFNLPGDFDIIVNPNVHVFVVVDGSTIFENILPSANFPIPVPVEGVVGSGETVVQFWLNNNPISYEIITF